MNNINHPKLQTLVGKTIKTVRVGTAHGEVLIVEFDDNTKLTICTYEDDIHYDDQMYVAVDGEEL